jgi:hypothetical protein
MMVIMRVAGRERITMSSQERFVAPNSCAVCENDARNHGLRFHAGFGLTGHIAPSNALRLERMKRNRELGLTATSR